MLDLLRNQGTQTHIRLQGTLLPKSMGRELLDMQEHDGLTVLARQVTSHL